MVVELSLRLDKVVALVRVLQLDMVVVQVLVLDIVVLVLEFEHLPFVGGFLYNKKFKFFGKKIQNLG